MKNLFKQVNLINSFLLILIILLVNGCAKKNNDTTPTPLSNTSLTWGEFIEIPGISSGVVGDDAGYLKTSNEGVYLEVNKASSANTWVYRLQNGGIPSWIFHEQPQLYYDWEPANETSESPDDFAIFFSTSTKNGYVNINTGLPALMEENHEPTFNALNEILVDNSSSANKWAFFGSIVKIQDHTNLGVYNYTCTVPNPGGVSFAEADPYEPMIWAASGKDLYKISSNGAITTFNVSAYDDPTMIYHTIDKIRFSYDVLHKDVYFRYQNKVFKIQNGTSCSLFYTIANGSNFLGGDFCIDNTYMYATDGTKKHLQLLSETNIIPAQPNTSNSEVLLDYTNKIGAFAIGTLEVSKDPLDQYIYLIANSTRLLKVPKSL